MCIRDRLRTVYFVKDFLFKLLVNNTYLERGFINDRLHLSALFFRYHRYIIHFPFLENHPFVKYYGLTEVEVRETLNKFNVAYRYDEVKDLSLIHI